MSTSELTTILQASNEKNAIIRAGKLKCLPVCGRCLGTGQYSFNGSHSQCYGCDGSGARMPKTAAEWAATLADAREAAIDSRLEKYLAARKAFAETKGAVAKVMGAWKAVNFDYSWQLAARWHKEPTAEYLRHREISDINKKCSDAFSLVSDVFLDARSATYDADCIALKLKMDLALAQIEAAKCEYALYLATH